METILKNLESVLCDPEGKCCITGSAADRSIVDDALKALRAAIAQPAVPVTDAELLAAGSELSNIAFNLAQWEGRVLSFDLCASLDKSRKHWDAAVTAAGLASRGQA